MNAQSNHCKYFPRTVFGRTKKCLNDASKENSSNALVEQLQRRLINRGTYFELEISDGFPTIADLPIELLTVIVRYVVGSELDVISLEMLSLVSSGFYLLARNYDIWYLICKKIFRVPCPNVVRDVDWRLMFMTIPHLYFHGVYIGKCSYVRYGEASFQVTRQCEPSDKSLPGRSSGRHKGKYIPHEVAKQEFHIQLRFGGSKRRAPHCVLQWVKYDCKVTYLSGETSVTSFDLVDKRYFPLLFFSRVRSFAQPEHVDNILE
ncbi:unnamed protein product [Enterobius vermicularis]|uniref:F-box domain-containing protein n=1 Tax=Enterobius vermicularis TaxID=51028 RepID=A0A0N4VMY8_ENTVE|nr:unnamed protein product [Enterobius vermicularis]